MGNTFYDDCTATNWSLQYPGRKPPSCLPDWNLSCWHSSQAPISRRCAATLASAARRRISGWNATAGKATAVYRIDRVAHMLHRQVHTLHLKRPFWRSMLSTLTGAHVSCVPCCYVRPNHPITALSMLSCVVTDALSWAHPSGRKRSRRRVLSMPPPTYSGRWTLKGISP